MKQSVQITVAADVPDEELGHEACVAAKDAVANLVQILTSLGCTVTEQSRRIVRKKTGGAPLMLEVSTKKPVPVEKQTVREVA